MLLNSSQHTVYFQVKILLPNYTLHHCKKKKKSCYEMLHRALEVGPCECGDEPLGSIKGGKFIDYLSEY